MPRLIVVLSGRVGAGKSTLARGLRDAYGFKHYKTHEFLTKLDPKVLSERKAFQEYGERLDKKTGGAWVAQQLEKNIKDLPADANIVLDSIRIEGQVKGLRRSYGPRVVHIHVDAETHVLAKRYMQRKKRGFTELSNYRAVEKNPTERNVPRLKEIADAVILTDRCTPSDVLVRAACYLRLHGRGYQRVVDVMIGGQYGSEGKGHLASYLAPEYDVLVRVGGPNAGHTVYAEPKPLKYHHLPSGTAKAPNTKIIIGAGAVIYPPRLLEEVMEGDVDVARLAIDEQAMVITERDIKAEEPLKKSIGSTGQGVGAATARRIMGRTDKGPKKTLLARDCKLLKPFLTDTKEVLEQAFAKKQRIFLEGTQGTGLSLYHGQYPYVTSRDTTVAGCLAEAGISPSRVRKVIMVCRTFPIRVQSPPRGTSGTISQEISLKEISKRSKIPLAELKKTERTTTTNRKRRIGEFDWHLLRQASSLNAPTDLALSFVDYLSIENRKARRFDQLTQETMQFIEEVERVAATPVSLVSVRFDYRSILDRRTW